MKLESKLGLSTGILVGAMLLSAFIAHLRIQEANRLSQAVTLERIPLVMGARDLHSHLAGTIRSLESYMLLGTEYATPDAYDRERSEKFALVDADLASLLQQDSRYDLGDDEGTLPNVAGKVATLESLEEKAEDMNESRNPSDKLKAKELLHDQILELDNSLNTIVTKFVNSQTQKADREMERLQQANSAVVWTLWIATLLGALVGGACSILLGRHITRALRRVAQRADAIAAGDLSGSPLDLDRKDQIGTLARAMDRMHTSLSGIIGTLATTASSLTGSATSMGASSDQIHRRIDQQSQQTQQAATAMQEMSASIAEVSRHTQSAADAARSASQTAQEGGIIVKQVLSSMHSIARAVSETSSTVELLGEDSARISQIVTVIDEIARKTNLLALNAAIEASRAGEQGRGFAVVAGEVRRLAESTAHATGEISSMIQGIQNRTRSAAASMNSGTETVQQGVVTTNQAGEALERIIGMAERVDRMIAQIAIAASQQAVAADQSSASLDSIHMLSNENLVAMATTAEGIESLRTAAVALEQQVDRFTIPTASAASPLHPTTFLLHKVPA